VLLVDTNVLLEATDEARPWHADARALLESPTRLVIAAQVIREYLVVATRPVAANGLGLPTRQALTNVREVRRRVRLLPEERPILPTFLELVERVGCAGKRIHDAHLVATARVHGVAAIVSFNADDLAALADGMPIVTPRQVLAGEKVGAGRRPRIRRGTRPRP